MNLVIKDVVAEDFERQTVIACSDGYGICKKMASMLNEAVSNVELFDNICSISYYAVKGVPELQTLTDVKKVFEEHKEDRG